MWKTILNQMTRGSVDISIVDVNFWKFPYRDLENTRQGLVNSDFLQNETVHTFVFVFVFVPLYKQYFVGSRYLLLCLGDV